MLTKTSNRFFDHCRLSAKTAGPHVLIMAGIHGDEFEPMLAAMNLIKKLPGILKVGKVSILPVANPSAYDLGKRCSKDKLDLARTFPGQKNGSYTERLAYNINKLIQSADFLIDLHTGGTLFDILPMSGYLLHPHKEVLAKQQQMAIAFGLSIIWGTDAQAQGRTLSAARDLNIPAIYAECRGGLTINETTVSHYEKGCLNVLNHLGLLNINVRKKNTPIWIEDYSPGEGHLQSKMPSPTDGIFVPIVSVGQKVKKGVLIGYVVDPVQNKKTKIYSSSNGFLFMLRISAKVNAGDSLGGILPVCGKGKKVIYAK